MQWKEIDKHKFFAEMSLSKQIHVCDAVTAACALIKRRDFIAVSGFDEIWYPIAFSDTNLSLKLKHRGLYSLYTPYAEAIHHESATRNYTYEDYESTSWLNKLHQENILSSKIQ